MLVRLKFAVHGNHRHSSLHGRQNRFEPLKTVGQQHANAVSRPPAQIDERVCKPVDPVVRLGEGEMVRSS